MSTTTKTKVLIIEDTRSFAMILKQLIQNAHGYECDIAESLEETKSLLQSGANEYFVAVVDFHLPDAPSGEAIDAVVACGIPSLVFTGTSDESLKEGLWDKGIADYASKSGTYNLEYVVWMVKRIHANGSVEVLVVDDSLVARKSMERLLKTQNFKVHSARSGEQALEVIKKNPDIRIAILDCYMDGMNGFELATAIRELHSRETMGIIGVSSQGGRGLSAQFIKSGANDFILKPFLPEEFLCRINHAIDRIESYFALEELNQVKNRFLGTAAHDIRGPIGSIKTASDYLLKRSPNPERTQSLLEMIQKSSVDLLELLETLLDISVIESGKPQISKDLVNVSKLVIERIELYSSEASSKNIEIKQSIAESVEGILDPIKVKQVFDNFITNAIKYSEKNSDIEISLTADNGSTTFSVRDAGPGIAEKEQEQLFQAFSVLSTKATGGEKKTGLGLAIAKSIVDAHKGKIYYKHGNGIQSTFYVDLPLK